jgi:hypothetical protein
MLHQMKSLPMKVNTHCFLSNTDQYQYHNRPEYILCNQFTGTDRSTRRSDFSQSSLHSCRLGGVGFVISHY